jgi:hypothetical protein
MRDNLRAALQSLGSDGRFEEVDQDALPEADIRRGWPAPTVLVDGADLFGMAPRPRPSMGCRIYPGGVPTAERIADRLRAAASR